MEDPSKLVFETFFVKKLVIVNFILVLGTKWGTGHLFLARNGHKLDF